MTSEEQKEEFEDILLEFHRYDISMADAVSRIEAALHSVEAEKEPKWISCDDRLPTEEDSDCQGNLWVTNDNELFEPCLMHKNTFNEIVREMGGAWVKWKNDITHWMPTGLARPAPPEHVEDWD